MIIAHLMKAEHQSIHPSRMKSENPKILSTDEVMNQVSDKIKEGFKRGYSIDFIADEAWKELSKNNQSTHRSHLPRSRNEMRKMVYESLIYLKEETQKGKAPSFFENVDQLNRFLLNPNYDFQQPVDNGKEHIHFHPDLKSK